MGIDDQKVKFDLFDTIEHSPDQDDCLKVNKEKNERVLKVGTHIKMQNMLMTQAITNNLIPTICSDE